MSSTIQAAGLLPSPAQASAGERPVPAAVKPEVARAARDFEAIFLRQMLSSLEKSSHLGNSASPGSDVYGSMMVGALADAVASAGGVGLAKYVTTSLAQQAAPVAPPHESSVAGIALHKPAPVLPTISPAPPVGATARASVPTTQAEEISVKKQVPKD